MATFDVCLYPDTCVHIVVEADDEEAAKEAAFTVFEEEIKEHTAYVMRGDWTAENVARIGEESDDEAE